jgi:hypothetical protein
MQKRLLSITWLLAVLVSTFTAVSSLSAANASNVLKLGDVDGNGTVNVADITVLINYLKTPSTVNIISAAADAYHDGEVNASDEAAIANIIMSGTPDKSANSILFFTEPTVKKAFGTAFANTIVRAGSTGAITYSASPASVATVNATTGEVTCVGAGQATVTATLAASGKFKGATAQYELNVAPVIMASAVTSSHIGQVICNNGHIHATVSAANSVGCTASAMIAYVGNLNNAGGNGAYSDNFNHGLAIALTDVSNTIGEEGSSKMQLSNAYISAGAYTRARSATYTSAWFLPSVYQWERILIGCGGTTSYTDKPSNDMLFSYGNFHTMMTGCGGTDVQPNAYWSSTQFETYNEWYYNFGFKRIYWGSKTNDFYVRAVLAF